MRASRSVVFENYNFSGFGHSIDLRRKHPRENTDSFIGGSEINFSSIYKIYTTFIGNPGRPIKLDRDVSQTQ